MVRALTGGYLGDAQMNLLIIAKIITNRGWASHNIHKHEPIKTAKLYSFRFFFVCLFLRTMLPKWEKMEIAFSCEWKIERKSFVCQLKSLNGCANERLVISAERLTNRWMFFMFCSKMLSLVQLEAIMRII